jgi:hypothetical protein
LHTAITRAAEVMKGFRGRWAVAGGWAVDLFLGFESRAHADVDVAILREDQEDLYEAMQPARLEKVVDRALVEWRGETLLLPVHEVHVGWPSGDHLEVLLNERDPASDEWVFRRDARIRRPIERVFLERDGVPFLAPEIVLLYKSKGMGAKDDADFRRALSGMDADQRSWLRDGLKLTKADHHWMTDVQKP